jgi:glycosyltransferase involved in cell wall biosynthesis
MAENPGAHHRPRLLVVGDAVAATGFARVLHSVLGHLAADYEIHHLGINYSGDPHDAAWKIYPAMRGGEPHGIGRLPEMMERLEPQLVFMLNDIWVLAQYMDALGKLAPPRAPRLVMYCPIEAGPIETETLARLEGVDRFVVYTQFARREIERTLARLRGQRPDFLFPDIEVIPHGVDTAIFPAHDDDVGGELYSPGRERALRALYGDDPDFRRPFIVLNANRNQPRKRIDITIKGFALFAAGKPDDVKLHLHMGVEDAGWNVITLANRHGIADRVILTAQDNNIPSVPVAQLRDIYTAALVGINTSTSEGWGLVSFEHAATGAAQIVPRHSACAELWDGAAMMLEPAMSLTNERILTEGKLVTPEAVADALEALYADRDLLRRMSIAAYRVAMQPDYRWAKIARRWHALFHEALEGARRDTDPAGSQ